MKWFNRPAARRKAFSFAAGTAIVFALSACTRQSSSTDGRSEALRIIERATGIAADTVAGFVEPQLSLLLALGLVFLMLAGTIIEPALVQAACYLVQTIKGLPQRLAEMLFNWILKALIIFSLTMLGLAEFLRPLFE
jgi:hypothetical protein